LNSFIPLSFRGLNRLQKKREDDANIREFVPQGLNRLQKKAGFT
jgi:hypothetical protein